MAGGVRQVLVVDDDEVSRELLMLFLDEAGYGGVAVHSGDEALAMLHTEGTRFHAVIADMQMPGTKGNALARKLRSRCAKGTRLIAMSGSGVKRAETGDFDEFLLKPFSVQQLRGALEPAADGERVKARVSEVLTGEGARRADRPAALDEGTFSSLSQSMPREQLMKLYKMCLDDAERRVGLMREACAQDDASAYERGAHAIKGGCGMVGAMELAALATEMEEDGLPGDGDVEPLERFLVASARLRRILDAKVE